METVATRSGWNGRMMAMLAGPLGGAVLGLVMEWGFQTSHAAAAVAALAIWMATWWMTEAIPLAATALLPIIVLPLIDFSQVPFRSGDQVGVQTADGTRLATIVSTQLTPPTALDPPSSESPSSNHQQKAPERTYQVRWVSSPTEPRPTVDRLSTTEETPEDESAKDETADIETADATLVTVTAQEVTAWGVRPSPLVRTLTPYADKFIFLFLGGFIVARGIERWHLHRRVALQVLMVVGTSPARLIAGAMAVTAGMSMWLSNTATTLVMLPVALSLTEPLLRRSSNDPTSATDSNASGFRTAMLLGIAYAAAWGGMMTPIGTPPNALLMREMSTAGSTVSFGTWMLFAVPLCTVMLICTWWFLVGWAFQVPSHSTPGSSDMLIESRRALGRLSRAEGLAGCIFVSVAATWVLREPIASWGGSFEGVVGSASRWVGRWDDATVAIAGAVAMFVVPVSIRPWRPLIDWDDAKNLPWDVLLLFGGGLCLSDAIRDSGLDQTIGTTLDGLGSVPLWLLVLIVGLIVTFLTELTSNMATAALFLPLVASLGERLRPMGATPELLMVPAALAASCAFMLPVATPPNALVFASGEIKIRDMARVGLVLNLVSAVAICLWVILVGRPWLGL